MIWYHTWIHSSPLSSSSLALQHGARDRDVQLISLITSATFYTREQTLCWAPISWCKHRKNCEWCPVSLSIKGSLWILGLVFSIVRNAIDFNKGLGSQVATVTSLVKLGYMMKLLKLMNLVNRVSLVILVNLVNIVRLVNTMKTFKCNWKW